MDSKEIIARRLAQCFRPGEIVNLGTGIPESALPYSDSGVIFYSDTGLMGMGAPVTEGPQRSVHFFNVGCQEVLTTFGACTFDIAMAFGLTRMGFVDTTVVGALQVSEQGDLANWSIPGRYFGMGGAMELLAGAKRVIVAMEHCAKNGTHKIVRTCTLPCTDYRCVDQIVTELCVLHVTPEGLLLKELAPGVTVEEVQSKTEPTLLIADDLKVMEF